MINYFRILGVKANASEDEIKKAYKRLSNKYHPDKLLNLATMKKSKLQMQLQRVKEAYDVLSDAKKRAAFIKDFNNVIVPDPAAAMKELWDQILPGDPYERLGQAMSKTFDKNRLEAVKNRRLMKTSNPTTIRIHPKHWQILPAKSKEFCRLIPKCCIQCLNICQWRFMAGSNLPAEAKLKWAHWLKNHATAGLG